jgi:hypothetical protein
MIPGERISNQKHVVILSERSESKDPYGQKELSSRAMKNACHRERTQRLEGPLLNPYHPERSEAQPRDMRLARLLTIVIPSEAEGSAVRPAVAGSLLRIHQASQSMGLQQHSRGN